MADEIRALAMTGMLGSGFHESSFERALSWEPHFIGCDAGSTDSGPGSLGTGVPAQPRQGIKRDLRIGLMAAVQRKIPLLVGSAGSGGGDANLAAVVEVAREIAREEGLHFRLAVIRAEQDKEYLKRKLAEGRIQALAPETPLDDAIIDRSERIVGMMGTEPFTRALEAGAEVVIAGRSSDTSMFAAIPLQRGFPAGPAWHAAKILECGAACVAYRTKGPDCMFARIGGDGFVMVPPHPEYACTPVSIAAHTFYETGSPTHLPEPGGTLDTSGAAYEALDPRTVRVTGSAFRPAQRYTVKLEGAESLGYQSLCIAGVRDPVVLAHLDQWLELLHDKVRSRVRNLYGDEVAAGGYHFHVHVYGRDGVLGASEPLRAQSGHELGLVLETTAPTQQMANEITAAAAQGGLHLAVPGLQDSTVSNLAFPYSPRHVPRGKVFRFNLNHVVEPADPCEMFPMELLEL